MFFCQSVTTGPSTGKVKSGRNRDRSLPAAQECLIRNPDDGFALLRLALSPLPSRLPLVAFVIFVIFVIFARSGSRLRTAGDADVSTRIPYQSSMAA